MVGRSHSDLPPSSATCARCSHDFVCHLGNDHSFPAASRGGCCSSHRSKLSYATTFTCTLPRCAGSCLVREYHKRLNAPACWFRSYVLSRESAPLETVSRPSATWTHGYTVKYCEMLLLIGYTVTSYRKGRRRTTLATLQSQRKYYWCTHRNAHACVG